MCLSSAMGAGGGSGRQQLPDPPGFLLPPVPDKPGVWEKGCNVNKSTWRQVFLLENVEQRNLSAKGKPCWAGELPVLHTHMGSCVEWVPQKPALHEELLRDTEASVPCRAFKGHLIWQLRAASGDAPPIRQAKSRGKITLLTSMGVLPLAEARARSSLQDFFFPLRWFIIIVFIWQLHSEEPTLSFFYVALERVLV